MHNKPILDYIVTNRNKIINHYIGQYELEHEVSEQYYTECYIKLIKDMEKYPTKVYTIHFFYTMIHNMVKMGLRSKKKMKIDTAEAIFHDDYYNLAESEAEVIYQNITLRKFWDDVLQFLSHRYTSKQLSIFKAKYKSKDNQRTIAKNFGKSPSTISNLLAKMLSDVTSEFKEVLADKYDNLQS